MKKNSGTVIATALAAVVAASVAGQASAAANLLVDPGFESGGPTGGINGDPVGWTSTDRAADATPGLGEGAGTHGGLFLYDFSGGSSALYQDVTTTAGVTYDWSLWEAAGYARLPADSGLQLFLGGSSVFDLVNPLPGSDPANHDYQQFTGTFVATSALTRFQLVGFNQTGGIQVDDLSFASEGGATGAVPEPAAWALMIAGFGMAGATLRRRRAAALHAAAY